MSKITDDLRDQLTETLSQGVTDEALASFKKKVQGVFDDIEQDMHYRLQYDLAPNLSAYVVDMAEKTVKAIIDGNEIEMRRYLGCEGGHWTGRSDSPEYGRARAPEEWHPVIHRKLFEAGAVTVRRWMFDAHRDLVVSERILDLEDQVKSLVAQVTKVTAEKEAMQREYR